MGRRSRLLLPHLREGVEAAWVTIACKQGCIRCMLGHMGHGVCRLCGKPLSIRGRIYCSKRCYGDAKFLHPKTCAICNVRFNGRENSRYCSLACARIGHSRRATKKCPQCGMQFSVKRSQAQHRKYCSGRCYRMAARLTQAGSRNPNWRGGISRAGGGGLSMYNKGSRGERKSRALLEADGWYVVRSAGSKGLWDLVCYLTRPPRTSEPTVRLIQVKSGSRPAVRSERDEIAGALVPSCATKEIWRWPNRARLPMVSRWSDGEARWVDSGVRYIE